MTGERNYQLKLSDGRAVTWTGRDGIDAARRYVDCNRTGRDAGIAVVAWREADTCNVVRVWGGDPIIE